MFGLTDAEYNVVKKAAKNCNAAGIEAVKNGAKYDQVMAEIISAHHKPIFPLISRIKFVWLCGYLAGRFGQTFDRE